MISQVHHILAEIIQGGLVLETNVEEIDASGPYSLSHLPLSSCALGGFYPHTPYSHSLPSPTSSEIKKGIFCISKSSGPRRRRPWTPRREPENSPWMVDRKTDGSRCAMIAGWYIACDGTWDALELFAHVTASRATISVSVRHGISEIHKSMGRRNIRTAGLRQSGVSR